MPSSALSRTTLYILSLHDALPIYRAAPGIAGARHRTERRHTHARRPHHHQHRRCRGELQHSGADRSRHVDSPDSCRAPARHCREGRSEEHTSELQSLRHLVCRLLLCLAPRSTSFPYTTLFRSIGRLQGSLVRGIELSDVTLTRDGRTIISIDDVAVSYSIRELIDRGTSIRQIRVVRPRVIAEKEDRKSTRLNSSHLGISYAVFCFVSHHALHPFPTRRSSDLSGGSRDRWCAASN